VDYPHDSAGINAGFDKKFLILKDFADPTISAKNGGN
jgi:hypothetical protein